MEWISVKEQKPPTDEPIVYRRDEGSKKYVGIAYWTVSDKWKPEAESVCCPNGFTHWFPLPPA
ncbi:hypothetical protein ACPV5U_08465 [Vibrio mediterranei]